MKSTSQADVVMGACVKKVAVCRWLAEALQDLDDASPVGL